MVPSAASPRVRRIQRIALALLLVAGVVNYIDRSTLAVGLPFIRTDLRLSLTQSGYLLSAFLWAYAIFQLPAGALVDRLGARFMLAAALGLWSAAQLLAAFVATFWEFVGVRILLGIGESPQYPTSARVVADWFAQRERGLATGIWNCSSTLGNAIAIPLLTFLMLALGWRWMFGVMGLMGLALGAAAYALHRDPPGVDLTPEERRHITDGEPPARDITWKDWQGLFRYGTTWGMVAGFFGNVYLSWIFHAWLPQYLEIQWHLSVAKTGWVASIPFCCGVVGSIAGGRLCDLFLKNGFSPILSRKVPMVGALVGSGVCTLLASEAGSAALAVVCISVTVFLLYVSSASAWAMATVATAKHCSASLGAIQNFGGYLGGALAPIVTGLIVDRTGSFRLALIVGACVVFAAALAHLVLVRGPIGTGPNSPRSGVDPQAAARVG
jgi:MFS family permease